MAMKRVLDPNPINYLSIRPLARTHASIRLARILKKTMGMKRVRDPNPIKDYNLDWTGLFISLIYSQSY